MMASHPKAQRRTSAAAQREGCEMNHYGAQMMSRWQEHRPLEYREIEEPQKYFAQLGRR